MDDMRKWLIISYKFHGDPSRKRVYAWRKLKELGVVYLQQGVGLLPYSPEHLQMMETLRAEIIKMEGESTLAQLDFLNVHDEEFIISEFQKARNEEYEEIVEQSERVIYELEREMQKGKYTFAEIEENEEEMTKIMRWMEKVTVRDFFQASGRSAAQEMIDKARKTLNEYADKVYEKENQH